MNMTTSDVGNRKEPLDEFEPPESIQPITLDSLTHRAEKNVYRIFMHAVCLQASQNFCGLAVFRSSVP